MGVVKHPTSRIWERKSIFLGNVLGEANHDGASLLQHSTDPCSSSCFGQGKYSLAPATNNRHTFTLLEGIKEQVKVLNVTNLHFIYQVTNKENLVVVSMPLALEKVRITSPRQAESSFKPYMMLKWKKANLEVRGRNHQ